MNQKKNVLCVDDEQAIRTVVQAALEHEGFAVETAEDGDVAIEMIDRAAYDVILLDVRMPRINGIDVLRHLGEKKSRARVIMLTGVDDVSIAIETVKLGASDYITKPFAAKELVDSIRRLIVP